MRIKDFLFLKVMWLTIIIVTTSTGDVIAQSITDTIYQIPAVVVSASRNQHFRNDIKTDVFLKAELSPYAGESLGRFLFLNTALNVKAYGIGGAASNVTLRGSSASHVQVNWNGFPINSVTLGSCDFSMVPVVGFDQISIVYGAPGALYGSGTFGGAINLDSKLKAGKAMSGSANIAYESLKTINGSASFHVGNDKLAWKVNAWGAISDNEFAYYDYITQSDRIQNDGKWHDTGVIQQLILKLSASSTLEAGLWYQVKAYNIPSRIGSTSYATQTDSTLKLFAAYKKSGARWGLQIKTAVFNDNQNYLQKSSAQSTVNSIESQISAVQWYGDANLRYYIQPHLSVDAAITGTYITSDVASYGDTKNEKGLTAFAGIKYDKNHLSWQAEVRKDWNSNFSSGILPSFGAAWGMLPDKWTFRANISKKYRKPTFNDLYWIPGGNQDLKPESGYTFEVGTLVEVCEKKGRKISTDLGLYWSEIKDMIVWLPEGAYWIANNYQRVHSAGIDASFLFDIKYRKWKYHSSLKLMLNRSTIKTYSGEENEKMLYSPGVVSSWENRFSVGIIDFTVWHHFTADRFSDKNNLLDPYQVFDVQTGVKIPLWKGGMGIYIKINNLTNTTYELIRLYPMPGRYWSVKMAYTF